MGDSPTDQASNDNSTASLGTPSVSAGTAPPLERGKLVGRYIIWDELGHGGMGTVYQAFDPELNRKVAVKVIQLNPEDPTQATAGQAMVLREAQALAKLAHPNVVGIYDVGTYERDRIFIAMELVVGQSLRAWLQTPRTVAEKLAVLRAAGEGLAAAHRAGLVHRDFKPENVLVGKDGRARVLDFGLARKANNAEEPVDPTRPAGPDAAADPVLTRPGRVMGTPAYLAPEQFAGARADARSDQFAFGITLYEALHGERPFQGPAAGRQATHRWQLTEPRAGARVPAWLRRIYTRALAVDPDLRYPDLDALLAELKKDPAELRRRWTIPGAVALLSVGAMASVLLASNHRSQLCRGAEQRLTGVWDAQVQADLRRGFLSTGAPHAGELFGRLKNALDAYATAWKKQYADNCAATRLRGEQSEKVMTARTVCLDRRRMELQSLTDQLRQPDRDALAKSVEAAYALTSLDSCADVPSLLAEVPPPKNAETRQRVEAIRLSLLHIKALYNTGRAAQAEREAQQALAQAEATQDLPIEAETRYELAQTEGDRDARAFDDLKRTIWAANGAHEDALASRALSDLIEHEGMAGRLDDAANWIGLADSYMDRLGRPPELYVRHLFARIEYDQMTGAPQEALTLAHQAVQIAQTSLTHEPLLIASAYHRLGTALLEAGHADQAVPLARKALALRESLLGPNHPQLLVTLLFLGTSLEVSGNLPEGEVQLRRALAASEPDTILQAAIRTDLAEVLHGLGRNDEAHQEINAALELAQRKVGAHNQNVCDIRSMLAEFDWQTRQARARTEAAHAQSCWTAVAPGSVGELRSEILALVTRPDGAAAKLDPLLASLEARADATPSDRGLAQLEVADFLSRRGGSPQFRALALAASNRLANTQFVPEHDQAQRLARDESPGERGGRK